MTYTKQFDPPMEQALGAATRDGADRRDGAVYAYTEEIILAVNVALATHRPLLVRGPSGSGKSSLAKSVARFKGWRYYEEVVTSRTQARDLLWSFDTLRRLNDAQTKDESMKPVSEYIRPGVLWWAFEPLTARWRSAADRPPGVTALEDPGLETVPDKQPAPRAAVVLIDEIDKADPDVPNNLLVPTGSLQFPVTEVGAGGFTVKASDQPGEIPLIVITTNDERELPAAFLRRCVMLRLDAPKGDKLVRIGLLHLTRLPELRGRNAAFDAKPDDFCRAVAGLLSGSTRPGTAEPPSTAEYLDALKACIRLGVNPTENPKDPHAEVWALIRRLTLNKERGAPLA